jgi:hypothetical protein
VGSGEDAAEISLLVCPETVFRGVGARGGDLVLARRERVGGEMSSAPRLRLSCA